MTRLGAFLRSALGSDPPDREAIGRIKEWARMHAGAGPDTVFAINEIACVDPACPGIETVILVMESGCRTRPARSKRGSAT
jgi:hypothetical protein